MSNDLKSAFEIDFERELELKLSSLEEKQIDLSARKNNLEKKPEQPEVNPVEIVERDLTTSGARADAIFIEERRQTCIARNKVRNYVNSLSDKSKADQKRFETKGLVDLETTSEKNKGKIGGKVESGPSAVNAGPQYKKPRSASANSFKDKTILLLALVVGILVLSKIDLRSSPKQEVSTPVAVEQVPLQSASPQQGTQILEQTKELTTTQTQTSAASKPEIVVPEATAGRDKDGVFRAFVSHGVPQAK